MTWLGVSQLYGHRPALTMWPNSCGKLDERVAAVEAAIQPAPGRRVRNPAIA
jgi:hypothetical protein